MEVEERKKSGMVWKQNRIIRYVTLQQQKEKKIIAHKADLHSLR